MTDPPCTFGRRWVKSRDSFTRETPDDSESCGQPSIGYTGAGSWPRCDVHMPKRYMVALGTSLTLTPDEHPDALTARVETASRLQPDYDRLRRELATVRNAVARFKMLDAPTNAHAEVTALNEQSVAELEANLERRLHDVTAWPATKAEIDRFEALVDQNKRFKTQRSIREHLAEMAS